MLRALLLCLLATSAICPANEADRAWERLTALDAGPGREPKADETPIQLSLSHLEAQEKALREFLTQHPADDRAFAARLRLARLLGMRAELKDQIEPMEVDRLLDEAEALATTPQKRADYGFATLTRTMRRWQGKRPDAEARAQMLAGVRKFQASHPKDARIPMLLVEVATLFEGAIATKEPLLREANRMTNDPALKAQIADDLRRLGHLGKPLTLRFTGIDGRKFDLAQWRGKPVVVLFFAVASEPARLAFVEMQNALASFGDSVGFVAVSLDTSAEDVRKFLEERKSTVPVGVDGKGWNGPIVQALGINAVPAAWIVDQRGVVRTLDALEDPAGLLRKLR